MSEIRTHVLADLLSSYRELTSNMAHLTLDELYYTLELEASTQRRPTVIDRLIRRIVKLESQRVNFELRTKYDA